MGDDQTQGSSGAQAPLDPPGQVYEIGDPRRYWTDLLEQARVLLHDLKENSVWLELHKDECPEDATCQCPRAMAFKRIMYGWTPRHPNPEEIQNG